MSSLVINDTRLCQIYIKTNKFEKCRGAKNLGNLFSLDNFYLNKVMLVLRSTYLFSVIIIGSGGYS